MSLLDDAFWDALDAARGDPDAAFPILKTKLASPSRALIQDLRWLRSRYADDTDDILNSPRSGGRDGTRRQTRPPERDHSLARRPGCHRAPTPLTLPTMTRRLPPPKSP